MDDLVRYVCNNCGKRMKSPAKAQGKTVRCSGCQATLTVPYAAEHISAPQPIRSKSLDKIARLKRPELAESTETASDDMPSNDSKQSHEELMRIGMVAAAAIPILLIAGGCFLDITLTITILMSIVPAIVSILPFRWAWDEMKHNGGIYPLETLLVEMALANGSLEFGSRKSRVDRTAKLRKSQAY